MLAIVSRRCRSAMASPPSSCRRQTLRPSQSSPCHVGHSARERCADGACRVDGGRIVRASAAQFTAGSTRCRNECPLLPATREGALQMLTFVNILVAGLLTGCVYGLMAL